MTTRRRFLANLGIGAAALMLRFRPESRVEIQHVVASGDFGELRWTISSAWRPVRQPFEPLTIHRCPPDKPNYAGKIMWMKP